ncbi:MULTISPECIES: dipeptidase PepV [Leuconostoc]|uniref:Dipeptidase n=1 Tax=Leuconostoc suionicum TaxID=1511761 RepID=A0A2N9K6U1_9LACO|nr:MULTISPECIES: dipeptidase PepV [Leuconostoc]API72478.1 dipeptidase PepV [Leuconostoc suionicum]MBE4727345.1 dipeptidase PepV [Leuconostoc suionicum]MCT4402962.1 dipeptidase PepV [Leuconostoc suionicum]MDC2806533.1 dipeptidase PepV [Leuconostoc suionicum]MDC2824045.1 dipeptidase PepV [Leuconostoc suionicum]
MTVDWKQETEKRKAAYVEDLKALLAVESVRDDSQATPDAPLGPGPTAALVKMLAIAERDGFTTKNIDNIVGYIEIGPKDADEYVAILSHVDVMPAGEGWDTEPFEPVVTEDKIIARGASDDKGPGMSAYYAFKILSDLKVPLKRRVRLIFGTDEENDWTGMTRYFEVEPEPVFGFSPDAEYPIINGEKGNVQVIIKGEATNGGTVKLVDFESGLRTNMVPGIARATVKSSHAEKIVTEFQEFLVENPKVSGSTETDGEIIKFVLNGKQVHGAMPETGENAGTYLANFLQDFDFGGTAKSFLTYLGTPAHDDTVGEKFGVKYTDDVMGPLSMNVGIQKFIDGGEAFINFNFRYPKGITPDEIVAGLSSKLNGWDVTPTIGGHSQAPHYVAPSDPIVETLLRVYHDQTGLPAHDQVIGGGTYGRLMKRGVAYGALFPDSPDTMHQVNEFALLDDLYRSISIYAQAIAEITNLD